LAWGVPSAAAVFWSSQDSTDGQEAENKHGAKVALSIARLGSREEITLVDAELPDVALPLGGRAGFGAVSNEHTQSSAVLLVV